ncbi:hypothetical protein [Breznakia pachnodae]|uniref:Transmembrane protein n=1 Tax=Breznakia pachnodae TaxID=265178 RepID=A0ABU0E3F6_9FIRM|nr:hypothetical protein [Breznakia pachnodae]MDQ0361025.1 hypothetical protein [Breznakia pachnodae]
MKVLLIIGFAGIICFSILLYLIKVLNKQKSTTNKIKYKSTFQTKEPNSILLMHALQLVTCICFIYILFRIHDYRFQNVIKTIVKQELKSQIIMIGFYLFLLIGCIYSIIQCFLHFNLYLKVDNDTLKIRNKFRKLYTIDKSQIHLIQIGSNRRPSDCSLRIEFSDNSIHHRFTMTTSWEFSLLLNEWIKHNGIRDKMRKK